MKGVNPIVASVLLIGFVLAAAAIVGPFFMDTLTGLLSGQPDRGSDVIAASNAGFEVSDTVYSSDSGDTNLTVRNGGSESLVNFSVAFISGDSVAQRVFNRSLDPGEAVRVSVGTGFVPERAVLSASNLDARLEKELSSVLVGTAPAAPTGLSATS